MPSSTSVAAHEQTFTPFPRLPQELREEIWTIAYFSSANRVLRFGLRTKERCTDKAGYSDNRHSMTVSGAEDSLIETCAESKRLVAKKSYTTTGFKYGGYELKDGPVWARLESEITFLESEKDPNRYNYKILKEMTLGLTASSFRTLVKTITLDLELQIDDLLEALASCPQLELFNLVIAATTNRHNSDRIGYSSNVREDTIQRKPLRRLGPSRVKEQNQVQASGNSGS